MKISVVTSVLNHASTIGDTIASVRRQTHRDVEHVVQDGGSTDGTLELLQAAASPRMRLECAEDSGIYHRINRGIERASGDVIGLLHSDDVFDADYILADVAEAFSDPKVEGIYGDLVYVAADDTTRVVRYLQSGPYRPEKLSHGWVPPLRTVYLRRSVFERFGLYDTEFLIAADYEAMLRYLVQGEIRLSYLPEVMVRMRLGGENKRSLGHMLRKSKEDYRVIRRYRLGGIVTLLAKNTVGIGQFIKKDIKIK